VHVRDREQFGDGGKIAGGAVAGRGPLALEVWIIEQVLVWPGAILRGEDGDGEAACAADLRIVLKAGMARVIITTMMETTTSNSTRVKAVMAVKAAWGDAWDASRETPGAWDAGGEGGRGRGSIAYLLRNYARVITRWRFAG
jgi:hypothetical protein